MTNLISKAFDGHNIHIITDQQVEKELNCQVPTVPLNGTETALEATICDLGR